MAKLEGICKSKEDANYFITYLNGNFSRPKVFKWRESSMVQWPNQVAPKGLIEWLD